VYNGNREVLDTVKYIMNNTCPEFHDIHHGAHQRTSPTGHKKISVLVRKCYGCGHLTPMNKLTWKEQDWIDRFNRRIAQYDDNL